MIIWLTGRSGSGKSVYAEILRKDHGFLVIDGDRMRSTLSGDLGFTDWDKRENGRRMIELCKLFSDQRHIVVSTITAWDGDDKSGRNWVRKELGLFGLKMVWIDATLEACRARDPKGLYKNPPQNLAGVTSKWEDPGFWDLRLDTVNKNIVECRVMLETSLKRWLA